MGFQTDNAAVEQVRRQLQRKGQGGAIAARPNASFHPHGHHRNPPDFFKCLGVVLCSDRKGVRRLAASTAFVTKGGESMGGSGSSDGKRDNKMSTVLVVETGSRISSALQKEMARNPPLSERLKVLKANSVEDALAKFRAHSDSIRLVLVDPQSPRLDTDHLTEELFKIREVAIAKMDSQNLKRIPALLAVMSLQEAHNLFVTPRNRLVIAPSASTSLLAGSRMTVLFAGVEVLTNHLGRRWSQLKGRLIENHCQGISATTWTSLKQQLCQKKPPIVVLGPDIKENDSGEPVTQMDVINMVREKCEGEGFVPRLILICDDEMTDEERERMIDEHPSAVCMSIQAASDHDRILRRLVAIRDTDESASVDLRVLNKKGDEERRELDSVEGAVQVMKDWEFVRHMKGTGHASSIQNGLVRLSSHFSGPRILDAGCGPGYVLGTFVRDWMATDFDVGARPNTTILSVDVSPESIEQAKARYERYLKYELLRADRSNPKKDRTLAQYVNAKFLQQDFMKLDPDVVWEMLGGPPSTILASYFISWVSKDKIGAAMQLAMLAGPGTKLVIVEEPDQTITTTGKYMDEVQASRIEQYIDPIESLDLYIDLLRRAGWVEIPDADVELPIGKEELQKQRKHTVRCKAFEIPLID